MSEYLSRPLEGVNVVELATFIAAPSCGRYLADLGANVIKVESPSGDPYRSTAINEGRPTGDLENVSFDLDNANKWDIMLDTKSPEGREVLEKLIARCDIFITNVRYKSLVKSGLDYETLKVKYPKLVMGYVTGYGDTGPDKDLPGFDFTAYFARGGILGTLYDKESIPMMTIPGFGDHPVGIYLASGLMAALYRAQKTGRGDRVTVSLFHSAIWAVSTMLQSAQYGQPAATYPMARRDITNPFTVAHKTSDGRWFQFAAPAYNAMYNRFVTALGHPELADDPRYYPQANLQANLHEFYEMLAETVAQKSLAEWCGIFKAADIPYAVAQTWDELLEDPQAWGSNCFYKMSYPNGAERTLVRPPVLFQDTPLPEYSRGPYPGEQTEQVLSMLGYTGDQIKAMLEAGAACHPAPREK